MHKQLNRLIAATLGDCTFCEGLGRELEVDDMQLEAEANLLVVAELVSVLEVEGHPAISPGCAFWEEVKLPAHMEAHQQIASVSVSNASAAAAEDAGSGNAEQFVDQGC